jgi:phosphotriesterase-related protein
MEQFVRTLTGDVTPESLGRTLIHEHLCVDWGEMVGRPKVLSFDYDDMVTLMVSKLNKLHHVGFGAMVECTPYGCGRYVDLFHDVARRSPVKIIASTGFFHESWCPIHPVAAALELDALTDLLLREITEGMGDTLIKAGMIKCATGEGRISKNEEKILRAAARARKATGCPIITHTTNGMGLEQLDLFESEGLSPEEVIVSHVDSFDYAEKMLKRGSNLSIDRIGTHSLHEDEHWINIVSKAVQRGYVHQVMISHDAVTFVYASEALPVEDAFNDYTYIGKVFLPKLQKAGVTDEQISIMLEDNPQRVLTFSN